MKSYIGTKLINAKPMTRLEYNVFRGWELPADENGDDEGFLVEYVDGGKANTAEYAGYVSWSPKDVFEKAYRLTEGMTFGEAVEALKAGKRVARSNWNGKGMWVGLIKPENYIIQASLVPRDEDPKCDGLLPWIGMKTVDNKFVPWLASQTDVLAEDWAIVE